MNGVFTENSLNIGVLYIFRKLEQWKGRTNWLKINKTIAHQMVLIKKRWCNFVEFLKNKSFFIYLEILKKIPSKSFDLIFSDPPYFLSNKIF